MAGDKVHRLALQISDDSPEKMNAVLNATNAARYYSGKGEELEIKVVAYARPQHAAHRQVAGAGAAEVGLQSVPNVTFEACNNTLEGMAEGRQEAAEIPLLAGTKVVPAGVVELMELNEAGWTIVRP